LQPKSVPVGGAASPGISFALPRRSRAPHILAGLAESVEGLLDTLVSGLLRTAIDSLAS
jgi:hypothetical protein